MELGFYETLPEEVYDEEEGVQNWAELQTVESDGDLARLLEDVGIRLVLFDMRSDEVKARDAEVYGLFRRAFGFPTTD